MRQMRFPDPGDYRTMELYEEAVKAYLEVLKRHKRDRKDLQTINRLSERLNREAQDVLSFQKDIQGNCPLQSCPLIVRQAVDLGK
jgi:hypothetical protein